MNILDTILLQAQGQGGGLSGMLMIVAMVVIFYFFMIRPNNKRQKELKQARDAMQNGDKVVVAQGIYGKVKEINDTTVMVEVAPGVTIKVDKNSVLPLVEQDKASKK